MQKYYVWYKALANATWEYFPVSLQKNIKVKHFSVGCWAGTQLVLYRLMIGYYTAASNTAPDILNRVFETSTAVGQINRDFSNNLDCEVYDGQLTLVTYQNAGAGAYYKFTLCYEVMEL